MLRSALRVSALSTLPYALAIAMAAQQAAAANLPFYPAVEGLTDVKSLDVTTDARAIHVLLVGNFSQRNRVSVAYVFSTDGGRTWSRPAFVDADNAPPAISRRGNDARLAVRGPQLVAVWQSKAEIPGAGEMAMAISSDRGKTWRPGANPAIGDATRNQSHMAVAADQAGSFHLIWLDDREENGNTQGLRYAKSTDGGLRWQPETTLDDKTCTCCWTRLAVLPDRSLALLYRDSDPHDMRFARLRPGQSQWRNLGAVGNFEWSFTGCPHCGGGLAASGTPGRMVLHSVVWTGKDDLAGLYYLRSTDSGARWSPPMKIASEQAHQSDIAAQPSGAVALTYVSGKAPAAPVYVRVSRDAGRRWSAPVMVSAPGIAADHPRAVATPFGFRVFWTESRPGGGKAWAMAAPSA